MSGSGQRTVGRDSAEALLERYIDHRLRHGVGADLDELCRDRPELREPLGELVRTYQWLGSALAPPGDLEPGRCLLHYRIVEKLGEGGMGEVYAALDQKLGRRVALKLLRPELAADGERLRRFRREARAVAAFNHRNIVTLYSVEEAEGLHLLTMELVEGTTLARRIGERGIPLAELLDIAIPIADALAAAHQRGIVHRDLKPGNVMVTEARQVKVLDFGLAKLSAGTGDDVSKTPTEPLTHQGDILGTSRSKLSAGAGDGSTLTPSEPLTHQGDVLGTLRYMSPEQIHGKPADARSDVFSVGVMLYEMATGQRPFQGKTLSEHLSAVQQDTPPPLTELNRELPDHLGRIVARCLEKDPRRRYQSALDVRDELAALRREVEATEVRPPRDRAAAPPAPSIAVLPFTNLSADPEDEYFSDGMTEEILNALSRLGELRVAARTSAFSFKGRTTDVAEVGAKLHVAHVLEGSVRRAGDRLRITARLIAVADGYQVWTERYDRAMADVFSVQDEIATAIADKLEVTLGGKPPVRPTRSLAAYDLYLKGRSCVEQRGPGLLRAVEYFRQALELDDGYALAHTGMADALGLATFYGMLRPRDAMPEAKAAARRALALDETLPQAHASTGWVAMLYDWDWATVAKEFQRAIELNPSFVQACQWYGSHQLFVEGDPERGLANCRRAVDLDPLSSPVRVSLGQAYIAHRRGAETIATAREVVDLDPTFFLAWFILGCGYLLQERPAEAVAAFEEACRLSRRHPFPLGLLGTAYMAAGDAAAAERTIDELIARSNEGYVQPFILALSHTAAGRIDEALGWLERAIEERTAVAFLLRCWPFLDPLRHHKRFRSVMRGLSFPGWVDEPDGK